jgi:transcriptional regulator with XRE-family HTH domain
MGTPQTAEGRIAEVVSGALESAGLTQSRVADLTGIPLATLNRRLRGITPFTYRELDLIAPLLERTVSSIAAEAERVA